MAERFSLNVINHFVLGKQYLAGSLKHATINEIVHDIGGLHATSAMTPYLSLLARQPDFKPKELDHHLYNEADMARLRNVRKTLYIHDARDIPVFYAATAQKVIKASENYMIYRGVPIREYKVLADSIINLLKKEPKSAVELKAELETDFDVSSVLAYMCDQGILVRGKPDAGWKDRRYRYMLFEELFPDIQLDTIDERDALPVVIRHYLRAFGPASMNDIIWWTGFGKIRVRSAIRSLQDELIEIEMAETNMPLVMMADEIEKLRSTSEVSGPVVNILPNLDSYLMGYIDRERLVSQPLYDNIFDTNGNVTNVVLLNGRAMGVWDCSAAEEAAIKLYLFDYQLAGTGDVIRSMVRNVGEFISGKDVRIQQVERMVPLTRQPAGSMMNPLKNM